MTQRLKFLLLVLVLVFVGYLLIQESKSKNIPITKIQETTQESEMPEVSLEAEIEIPEVFVEKSTEEVYENQEDQKLSSETKGTLMFPEFSGNFLYCCLREKSNQVFLYDSLVEGANSNQLNYWGELFRGAPLYLVDEDQAWYTFLHDDGPSEMRELHGIDLDNMRTMILGESFVTDGSLVFYRGKQLLGANPQDLRSLGNFYYTDDVFVYLLPVWEGSIIRLDQADPATFQIETEISAFPNDPRHDFEYATPLDPTGYAYDKNSLYYEGGRIGSSSGYEILNHPYRKTNEAVFILNNIGCLGKQRNLVQVENVDPKTFQIFSSSIKPDYWRWSHVGFDKDHVFVNGVLQENSDPSILTFSEDGKFIEDVQGNSWSISGGSNC